MTYIVLRDFHDLTDSIETKTGRIFHQYHKGDVFPRAGHDVDEGRIAELAGTDNAQHTPLIGEVRKRTRKKKED